MITEQAVAIVRQAAPDYASGLSNEQIADSLRAAARRGTIAASQTNGGHWLFNEDSVRTWAEKVENETRGRPRKETE